MPDYSRFEKVLAHQDGRLLTLTFNRPDNMNAINGGVSRIYPP